jgi:hypothetical protein
MPAASGQRLCEAEGVPLPPMPGSVCPTARDAVGCLKLIHPCPVARSRRRSRPSCSVGTADDGTLRIWRVLYHAGTVGGNHALLKGYHRKQNSETRRILFFFCYAFLRALVPPWLFMMGSQMRGADIGKHGPSCGFKTGSAAGAVPLVPSRGPDTPNRHRGRRWHVPQAGAGRPEGEHQHWTRPPRPGGGGSHM